MRIQLINFVTLKDSSDERTKCFKIRAIILRYYYSFLFSKSRSNWFSQQTHIRLMHEAL